ncbi:hypothetical protein SAMN05446927_5267 [Caballeronia arationis]|uniref:DNA-directed DNA polymerase family A palm domain-containing protein n=1 Tax=Caballeronia arationis TaxID=1777142 RepID=A0A7Z7IB62_9BURK|nr:hypothetical protein [Caballeronia arationis]SOE81965.1 hypothetical protein SAMN05446927_5267 [Caballeronia arationis]
MEQTEQTKDQHFNSHRIARSAPLGALVGEVIREVEQHEQSNGARNRKRKQQDQAVFERQIECLISEAAFRDFEEPGESVTISRSKQVLGRYNRYQSSVMGKTLPTLLDALSSPAMGLFETTKGVGGSIRVRGVQTTYRASPKLLGRLAPLRLSWSDFGLHRDEEVIVLKAPKEGHRSKAKRIQYEETGQTIALRAEMRAINDWLESADIAYLGMPWEVDATDRRMRRTFNKGRFDLGGRMFGGFWQGLHKPERKAIRIDGREVTVLDFSHVGPRILYGMAGAVPVADAYAVPGYADHREGIKKVFAAMTYADKPLTSFPRETKSLFPRSARIGEVCGAIERHHPELSSLFYTGVGLEVMHRESQIMVAIMLELKEQGIVGLPIHDAVVVREDHAQQTETIMLEVFRKVAGIHGRVEVEE